MADVGDEQPIVESLVSRFSTRLKQDEAREFALANRILLLNSSAGVPIDVSLGALDFEREMIARARRTTVLHNAEAPLASAEDLVVMKVVAGRPGDWRDIDGIIASQRRLDWKYIWMWLNPLLETLEVPERASQLEQMRARQEQTSGAGKSKKPPRNTNP